MYGLRSVKHILFAANAATLLLIVVIGLARKGEKVTALGLPAGELRKFDPIPSHDLNVEDLARRNPFVPLISLSSRPKTAPPPPAPPPPKIPISQKAAHLRLVGILKGKPTQAILEDARRHTTLYVTAGQILDDLTVEQILDDRVILSSEGDHLDLML